VAPAALALVAIATIVTVFHLLPTEVTAVLPRRETVIRTLVLTGRVRASARTRVGATVTGTVREVRVREGDHVARGALLLTLDDAPAMATLAQARAALAAADARARATADQAALAAAQAERDLSRARALFAQGAIAARDLELAEHTAASARLELDAASARTADARGAPAVLADIARARAAVAAAEAQVALARIAAPAGATVLARDAEPGDLVVPGRVLFDLALDGPTELVAYPREENLAALRPGATAVASADAFPRSRFDARVTSIAPMIDPAQGTVEIRLAVRNPPSYLRADMTVSINVDVARRDSALVLPVDHVGNATGAAPWVLVERDGRAERRPVRLGILGDGVVEILAGLHDGEGVLPMTVDPGKRVRVAVVGSRARVP
jgi:HlyD family secretion protein